MTVSICTRENYLDLLCPEFAGLPEGDYPLFWCCAMMTVAARCPVCGQTGNPMYFCLHCRAMFDSTARTANLFMVSGESICCRSPDIARCVLVVQPKDRVITGKHLDPLGELITESEIHDG